MNKNYLNRTTFVWIIIEENMQLLADWTKRVLTKQFITAIAKNLTPSERKKRISVGKFQDNSYYPSLKMT